MLASFFEREQFKSLIYQHCEISATSTVPFFDVNKARTIKQVIGKKTVFASEVTVGRREGCVIPLRVMQFSELVE